MNDLRPYQASSVSRVRSAWDAGDRRVLLALPTGSGKTKVASEVARLELQAGGRVLFLAHTREIAKQATARMPPGVVVGMVQALTRRTVLPCDPTLAILDESHHAAAPSFRRLLNRFRCRMLGLSATPDSPGLAEQWDTLIIGAQPSELLACGALSPLRLVTHGHPNTAGVRLRGDEWDSEQLARVTNVTELRGDVLATWQQHATGLQTIGFACNRAHSRALTADFSAAGIPAAHVDGDMSAKERDSLLERFASGDLRVLWNCDLFGEGLDLPGVRCVIQARPLHTLRAFLQQSGRARAIGSVGILLDHGGNVGRHGHPRADREWSLCPGKTPRIPAIQAGTATDSVPGEHLRLVVECPAPAVQIDPELQALGFVPDPMPVDESEQVTEKLTGLAA